MSYTPKNYQNVEVRDSEYRFTHGHQPRGYGFWFFEIAGQVYGFYGNYGECKKQAQQKAIELGQWFIKVGA